MLKSFLKYKLAILICLLAFPFSAQGQQVTLQAQVDKTQVRMGENIRLQIIVQGTQDTPQPQIPRTKDFNLSYHGQSSQFKMVNGKTTSSITYTYTVFPLREGEFSIGPVQMVYKRKKLRSNAIRIKVLSANTKLDEPRPVILRALISNKSPYYNEQIIFTLQFARRVDVFNARVEMPTFDGFWAEDLGEQREVQRVIEGHTYMVTELRKALFPSKIGKLTIEPTLIHCEIVLPRQRGQRDPLDAFFFGSRHRTKPETLSSSALEINVKPLPEKGKPDNFYPLVGKIKLVANLSKRKLEAGDSSTYTITIIGNANIRDAALIDPPQNGNFKIYDDKPIVEFKPQENSLLGRKVFKKAIVPLNPGKQELPAFKINYFNPNTKRYETVQTKPLSLTVTASAEKEKLHAIVSSPGTAPKRAIKILGKDILTVYTHPDALIDKTISSGEYFAYIIFFLLPPCFFIGIVALRQRNQLYQQNTRIRRRKKAFKIAERALQKLSAQKNAPSEFYPQVSKILKEYLGNKFDLSGGALTSRDMEIKLKQTGVETEAIDQLKQLMEQCEFCQFASSDNITEDCNHVLEQTKQLLNKLEKHL